MGFARELTSQMKTGSFIKINTVNLIPDDSEALLSAKKSTLPSVSHYLQKSLQD